MAATCRTRLEEGPLPARQVAQLGADIAEALEYVHHRGVVHRDIKPANILLGDYLDDGQIRAKLTDFGIATLGGSDALTGDEVVTGTVAYLSPEQASGGAVDASTDVYSLGSGAPAVPHRATCVRGTARAFGSGSSAERSGHPRTTWPRNGGCCSVR